MAPEEPERPLKADSQLVQRVLEPWAWGYLPAPTVQHIMEAALMDGATQASAAALANVGSAGRWPQNCQRDL